MRVLKTDAAKEQTLLKDATKSGARDFSKALAEKRKQTQPVNVPVPADNMAAFRSKSQTDEVTRTPPALNVDQLAREIVDHISAHEGQGRQTVEIQFNSQTLTGLGVRITGEQGAVSVHFITPLSTVASLVRNNLTSLRGALESRGIRVTHLGVNAR